MTTDDAYKVLTEPPPALSGDEATRLLYEQYDIAGELKSLTSERDQNFLVTTKGDEQFVLKIANSSENPAVTRFQTAALMYIAENSPTLKVPRLVRTIENDTVVGYVAADGRRHLARVLTWLDGVPLQHAPGNAETLGECLARLGHALRGFDHAASGYPLLWDLKRASQLWKLVEHVADDELQALCRQRLDVFETRVATKLDNVRWQVIYNDLNPSNVLVDPQDTSRITGVIDFGDMVRSPLIVDVAVAASYLVREDGDALADVLTFVAAYCEIEQLRPAEVDILFDLVLTRSTMTILITHWRAARYPENREYILRNEAKARQMLETLSEVPHGQVTQELYNACGLL